MFQRFCFEKIRVKVLERFFFLSEYSLEGKAYVSTGSQNIIQEDICISQIRPKGAETRDP